MKQENIEFINKDGLYTDVRYIDVPDGNKVPPDYVHHAQEEVVDMALLAGHILLANGAEISRIEDTIRIICTHFGVRSENAFVLSNGIFMTAGSRTENTFAKVEHIPVSATNLEKVAAVNQLSREISEGKYTLGEARAELEKIQVMPGKGKAAQIFASGLGSAAFCYLFGGTLIDAACAFAAGCLLYIFVLCFAASHLSKIMTNIMGGMIVTAICCACYLTGIGQHMNFMIIGSVMPLIPGVSFTNAIRDIADGDYIAGSVRMLDAMLGFVCIAIGVGICIYLVSMMMGGTML